MDLAVGDHISVRTAAEKMIATSDNMATDMLIGKLGPQAIDDALANAGHHDPAAMTPFPTMYELFSVRGGSRMSASNGRAVHRKPAPQMLHDADSACLQTGSVPRPRAGLGIRRGMVWQR